jgi:hypothetical protein
MPYLRPARSSVRLGLLRALWVVAVGWFVAPTDADARLISYVFSPQASATVLVSQPYRICDTYTCVIDFYYDTFSSNISGGFTFDTSTGALSSVMIQFWGLLFDQSFGGTDRSIAVYQILFCEDDGFLCSYDGLNIDFANPLGGTADPIRGVTPFSHYEGDLNPFDPRYSSDGASGSADPVPTPAPEPSSLDLLGAALGLVFLIIGHRGVAALSEER